MGQIRFEKRGPIAWVILDNQSKRNAVDPTMIAQMEAAYAEIEDDADVRVAIITGAGEKAFSAGADIRSYLSNSAEETSEATKPAAIPKPNQTSKPYIAAIRGYCLGGGFGLAIACDLRIAASDMTMAAVALKRGVVPAGQQAERLVKLVPFGKALELLLLARQIDAKEALAIGLVQTVVEPDVLLQTAQQWAETIAQFNPAAVRSTKRLAYAALPMSWDDSFQLGSRAMADSLGTEDSTEGFTAFLEGRPAVFSGR